VAFLFSRIPDGRLSSLNNHNHSSMPSSTRFFMLTMLCFLSLAFAKAQTEKQQKMQALNFMVGEWVGTSRLYENGELTSEVPAFQNIEYDVDGHVLVIQLNSETLQLHTIIYYDENDGTYYYHPFSKRGMTRAPATLENGRLIVRPNQTTRYIFSQTENGGFKEYGEKLIDGQWIKYFEDTFTDSR
jgi:hypothetical protein